MCSLVKKSSDLSGGDSWDFVLSHCDELIKRYPDESIEEVIACYSELISQLEYCKGGKC